MYKLGWEAAMHGELREWVLQYGSDALRGYDDYWETFGP